MAFGVHFINRKCRPSANLSRSLKCRFVGGVTACFWASAKHKELHEVPHMDSQASQLTLGLLPEPSTRWGRFVLSYGVQSLVVAFIVIAAVANPDVLDVPIHDYHFVSLVSTPPPVPQAPAPVKHFPVPKKIVEPVAPRPEAMRVPTELVRPKKVVPDEQAPKVTLAAKKEQLPDMKPLIPRPPVKTNVFSTGSSATPTMAAAPQKVQTGGFGDPNGVPAKENSNGKPATIAQLGSFDLPTGPGYGNGTGGAKGARGVVASTGFGNGVATGDGSGRVNTSRGNGVVRQAGFGDADPAPVQPARPKAAEVAPRVVPA